jgi:hypothetical protein
MIQYKEQSFLTSFVVLLKLLQVLLHFKTIVAIIFSWVTICWMQWVFRTFILAPCISIIQPSLQCYFRYNFCYHMHIIKKMLPYTAILLCCYDINSVIYAYLFTCKIKNYHTMKTSLC